MIAIDILGFEIPDSRPLFLTALGFHVAAGLVCTIAGATAAFSRKRPGRHPTAGKVYVGGLAVIFVTATIMAVLRWQYSWYLFIIACVAFGLGVLGVLARERQWNRWMTWHGSAMGMSYVTLLTGFYLDNGHQLPLWNRLPHIAYWFLPSVVGVPIILIALARNHALPGRERRPTHKVVP